VIAATQLWWDTARAAGIVSWCLLAGGVLWGLAISTKATLGRVRPNWMLDLHRFLGGLAVVFVAVHVGSVVLDSFVHFGSPTCSSRSPAPGTQSPSPGASSVSISSSPSS
jgi:hypothetical protein